MRLAHSATWPLPCKWDGRHVEWGHWGIAPLLTHIEPRACESCGNVEHRRWQSKGRRGPRLLLIAERCTHCGQIEVDEWTEDGTIVTWLLDETDFGPEGSYVRQETLL